MYNHSKIPEISRVSNIILLVVAEEILVEFVNNIVFCLKLMNLASNVPLLC